MRKDVETFAEIMDAKLTANAHKGHWGGCAPEWLLVRLQEECGELARKVLERKDALTLMDISQRGTLNTKHAEQIAREAADVANFALMVADVCGGLSGLTALACGATKPKKDGDA